MLKRYAKHVKSVTIRRLDIYITKIMTIGLGYLKHDAVIPF